MTTLKLTNHAIHIDTDRTTRTKIYNHEAFGYKTLGYTPRKGRHYVEYRVFDVAAGTLPIGHMPELRRLLTTLHIKYEVIDKRTLVKDRTPVEYAYKAPFPLRSYQEAAVEAARHATRGTIQLPCGSGKTVIACQLIKETGWSKALILVPSRELHTQTSAIIKEQFGLEKVCLLGSGSIRVFEDGIKSITISTYQTAAERPNTPAIRDAQFVIADEVHRVAAESFKRAMLNVKAPQQTIGLTASPFRDDNAFPKIVSYCGEIIYRLPYSELYDMKCLVPAVYEHTDIYKALSKAQAPFICITEKVADLAFLRCVIDKERPNVRYLNGSSNAKDRAQALEQLASGVIEGVVCTPILDEGVDVPNAVSLILYESSKSTVKMIQRVGRVQRIAPGKEVCYVYDVSSANFKTREAVLRDYGITR